MKVSHRMFLTSMLFIFTGLILAKDKVFLKSGDVLNMKVERFKKNQVYLTDSLNRLTLPLNLLDHIEYENPRELTITEEDGDFKKTWLISHFSKKYVYLYNQKSKKSLTLPVDYISREKLRSAIPNIWGYLFSYNYFLPEDDFSSLVSPGSLYSLAITQKGEVEVSIFNLFFDLELSMLNLSGRSSSKRISIYSLTPYLNHSVFYNAYARLFISYGLGASVINVSNKGISETDLTANTSLGIVAEIFVLPYVSIRTKVAYLAYLQETNIPAFTGINFGFSVGYYLP